MQADLVDALKTLLAEKDSHELLERLVAEKDTRLAERDEQIAALRRRVRGWPTSTESVAWMAAVLADHNRGLRRAAAPW